LPGGGRCRIFGLEAVNIRLGWSGSDQAPLYLWMQIARFQASEEPLMATFADEKYCRIEQFGQYLRPIQGA
jgi:hypothetical protein